MKTPNTKHEARRAFPCSAANTDGSSRQIANGRGSRLTRRGFSKSLAGAAMGLLGAPALVRGRNLNSKLNIAVVGIGGRGAANLGAVAGENIVALCDVDQNRARAGFAKFPQAKKYADFRKMLDQLRDQLDAVVVSTPDHSHAPAVAMALRMGKHCYCEKPLTHSVYEARMIRELAAKKSLATQMGTQKHATDNYRRTVELVRSGSIGSVEEVHVWCGKDRKATRPSGQHPPVPDHLDWDLWLGPAPSRPYDPCYVPANWRWWWDFANGLLGDMGCHYIDLPFWALQLRYPTKVEAEGPPVDAETTPCTLKVQYEFPARESLPPVKLTWYHGPEPPAVLKQKGLPIWKRRGSGPVSGVLFVGREGMLMADFNRRKLFPESKYYDFQPPEPTIPDSPGHHQEWITACKTGAPTTCNFDYSGALTEAVLLGNVAFRTGEQLQWDAQNLKAVNCPEAERLIRREYRKGWSLL